MHSVDLLPALQERVPLAGFSTLGVGGSARWFIRVTSTTELVDALRWSSDRRVPVFLLGGGSNVVIADTGFIGLVIHMRLEGMSILAQGTNSVITAGAGEPWDGLVRATVERGLVGLECLSGIPGSVGGTPIQNVGAYGQEVANSINHVKVYDRQRDVLDELGAQECGFAYRTSRFKGADAGRFVVCEVSFRLDVGRPTPTYPDVLRQLERDGIAAPSVSDVRDAVLAVRRRKGMVLDPYDPDTRSVGSFFMNPIVMPSDRERIAALTNAEPPAFAAPDGRIKLPAAWLIEHAGFQRGESDGPAGISTKHTLALVNRGGATARDVLRLAARIKRRVVERFGIWLRPEPVFVGFDGDPDVEFLGGPQGLPLPGGPEGSPPRQAAR